MLVSMIMIECQNLADIGVALHHMVQCLVRLLRGIRKPLRVIADPQDSSKDQKRQYQPPAVWANFGGKVIYELGDHWSILKFILKERTIGPDKLQNVLEQNPFEANFFPRQKDRHFPAARSREADGAVGSVFGMSSRFRELL